MLQTRITNMLGKNVGLTNVVQIMLFHRILPCQRWTSPMWEFNLEGPRTVKHFFGLKLEEMRKLFFGQKVECPDTTEDAGLSCNRLDAQVSNLDTGHLVLS